MPEPALQGQLSHAGFPHAGGVGMSQRMRCDAGRFDPGAFRRSREGFCQRGIGQGLRPPRAVSADEKDERRLCLAGTVTHDIGADGIEGLPVMEVDDTLDARLSACPFRVVSATSNGHAPPPIGDILEMQTERFAWPQPTVQHQQHKGAIA